MTATLHRRGHELADPSRQLAILSGTPARRGPDAGPADDAAPAFAATLADHGSWPLTATGLNTLQVNVGKLCNMTCAHCHVDAGPDRKAENMDGPTMDAVLALLAETDVRVLDLTGGAPEMNPHFRRAVETATSLGRHVIDRCNLTILTLPKYRETADFLAEHAVEVVASLPCYLEENCDAQRGDGTFGKSIEALRRLNELGYGSENGPNLSLVYNPVGTGLPPDQADLEAAYRDQLRSRYGIEFTRLFTITNMPISRFLDDLIERGEYDAYMHKLVDAFNPAAIDGLMCRDTLSISWDGRLFDCDFNQMLELPLARGLPTHVAEVPPRELAARLAGRRVATAPHCYGCTAGAGSGCTGAIL